MACLPSDDILGFTEMSVLLALAAPTMIEEVAQETGLPLFRVRGAVRRLIEAGLTHQVEDRYEITRRGAETFEKSAPRLIIAPFGLLGSKDKVAARYGVAQVRTRVWMWYHLEGKLD